MGSQRVRHNWTAKTSTSFSFLDYSRERVGRGIVREFGMNVYTLLYLKHYYVGQGTLLQVMWQPGWEGGSGERGYMYAWVPLLSTWNYHKIVNQLHSRIKIKSFKKKSSHLAQKARQTKWQRGEISFIVRRYIWVEVRVEKPLLS